MKNLFLVPFASTALFLASYGGGTDTANDSAATDATSTEATSSTSPAASEPAVFTVEGNDQLKFDKTSFTAKAGQEIQITLKNVGELPKESMGHNIVVLAPGTDLAAFGGEAFKAKDADYIPATYASSIIAHTKLLGPGESDTITFTIDEAGEYEFVCSFPGHWGTMRGTITVQ